MCDQQICTTEEELVPACVEVIPQPTLLYLENICVSSAGLLSSRNLALAVLWPVLHVAAAGRMCHFVSDSKIYGGLDTARD